MTLLDYWSNATDHEWFLERNNSVAEESTATAEEVLFAHVPLVYKVARRVLGNEADAEDVTQDVLYHVLHKVESVRDKNRLTGWLHRVTVNAALQHRRKAIRYRKVETNRPLARRSSEGSEPDSCPAQRLLDNELRERIDQALERLPEIYRKVYVLADIEELSNPEIGEILNMGVAAVKSRLHRARAMMRQALAPYF